METNHKELEEKIKRLTTITNVCSSVGLVSLGVAALPLSSIALPIFVGGAAIASGAAAVTYFRKHGVELKLEKIEKTEQADKNGA